MSGVGTLYKWTGKDGEPANGGRGTWPLPNGKPGEWREVEGELVACQNGLHLCRRSDLLRWLPGRDPELYEAEHEGEIVIDVYTLVVRRARLVRRLPGISDVTLRLCAADCAESMLYRYERKYPGDDRPRKAIEAARRYALGEIDDAARAAAGAAARAAARAAWWDAAWAARAAAGAAARDAARDAAWDAARDVFTDRLLLYAEHGQAAMDEPLPDIEGIVAASIEEVEG